MWRMGHGAERKNRDGPEREEVISKTEDMKTNRVNRANRTTLELLLKLCHTNGLLDFKDHH